MSQESRGTFQHTNLKNDRERAIFSKFTTNPTTANLYNMSIKARICNKGKPTMPQTSTIRKPLCGANLPAGPCERQAMKNGRCSHHGGLSTGPKSQEARRNLRSRRLINGRHSMTTFEAKQTQQTLAMIMAIIREIQVLSQEEKLLLINKMRLAGIY